MPVISSTDASARTASDLVDSAAIELAEVEALAAKVRELQIRASHRRHLVTVPEAQARSPTCTGNFPAAAASIDPTPHTAGGQRPPCSRHGRLFSRERGNDDRKTNQRLAIHDAPSADRRPARGRRLRRYEPAGERGHDRDVHQRGTHRVRRRCCQQHRGSAATPRGRSWSTAARLPSSVARRPSPTPRSSRSSAWVTTT